MSFIYLLKSNIEASFLTGVQALSFDKNNSLNDLCQINYLPLNLSISLLHSMANQKINYHNFYQELFDNDDYFFCDLSLDEGAIALFPLFLYFYGDSHNLEQVLEKIKTNHFSSNFSVNSWKILVIVINLIIEKKINNTSISQDITSYLEEYQEEDISEIKLIEELINKRIYLTQAEEILRENIEQNSLGIYQSIYNFYCLPHNSKITLLRSQQFTNSQETTRVLTGFLLGLNHGYAPILSLGDIKYQGKTIDKIVEKFVAQWQGKLMIS